MPIQEQTLIEAIMDTRGQVDFIWQFFISVQIAVFALIIIYGDTVEGLRRGVRMLAIGAVATFNWINANALLDAYRLLDAFHQQLRADYGQMSRFEPLLYERLVLVSYEGKEYVLLLTHGTAFLAVSLALVWQGSLQRRRENRRDAAV